MSAIPETRLRRVLLLGFLLTGVAGIYLLGLGRLPLFGRDEALYAEAAREMLASGDWITPRVNGVFFFEKPPLNYWLAAISYRLLGVSPLAARLPAALLAIATILITTTIGARVWGRRAGLLAGLALATSLQMAMIGRMGIMDVPLTFLVTAALFAYARWRRHGRPQAAVVFGALTGLAFLLKGLAGGLAPAIAVIHALTYRRGSGRLSARFVVLALLVFVAVSAPWFATMLARHGDAFVDIFIKQQHGLRMTQQMQRHGGPVFYYLALIVVSFFPWVAFLPTAFAPGNAADEKQAFWRSLAITWVLVVLVPFSLISTKLPGYVTPLYPAMALLVGAELDRRLREPNRAPWIMVIALGCLLAVFFALLPAIGAKVGERAGASREASALIIPSACWVIGLAIIVLGSIFALKGNPRRGIGLLVVGQVVVVGALLFGVLPVLSPYLGGGPAYLAQTAQLELPGSRIILYETRPEGVAFVLRRPVPVFSHNEKDKLLSEMRRGPTALIVPRKERKFWETLPHTQVWPRGSDMLLEVPQLTAGAEAHGAENYMPVREK